MEPTFTTDRSPIRPAWVTIVCLAMFSLVAAGTAHAQGAYGSHVEGGDGDEGDSLSSFSSSLELCFVDEDGSGSHGFGEPLYATSGCDAVSETDVRLTDAAGFEPGTQVASGDADEGTTLDALQSATVQYYDEANTGSYSSDPVYVDVNTTSQVAQGDARLTPTVAGDPGTFVRASDSDAGRPLSADRGLDTGTWKFQDADGSGAFTLGERVYIDADADGNVSVGDVRLGPPGQDPVASFTFTPSDPQADEAITFDASGSEDPDGTVVTYRWNFDDGTTRSTSDPTLTYTYDDPGLRSVQLEVEDDDGRTDTTSEFVPVDPTAACEASPRTVEPGESVTLDASASNADQVEFDKEGDGATDHVDDQDFVWVTSYSAPGTYQPQVQAQDASGNLTRDASCGEVEVGSGPIDAAFDYAPAQPEADEAIIFDASASSSTEGSIVEYRWDFTADGTIDETTASETTTYAYQQPGSYNVELTVRDDAGNEAQTSEFVHIDPSALCEASPVRVEPGEPVTLDASDSKADGARFSKDGNESFESGDEANLTRQVTYNETGVYEPYVQTRFQESRNEAPCGEVTVEPDVDVQCVAWPRNVPVGDPVTLDASSPEAIFVDFSKDGEGGYDDRLEERPFSWTTTYQQPGTYEPHVAAWTEERYRGTSSCGEVEVHGPRAVCRAHPTSVEPNETVTLDGRSSRANRVAFATDEGETFRPAEEGGFVENTTYEEPGTYHPQMEAYIGHARDVVYCGEVTVEADGSWFSWWLWPAGIGGIGGLVACRFFRGLPAWLGGPPPGILSYATGTFELSTAEDPVHVDVGFEPDLVLLTASANVKPEDPRPDRSDGWCFGTAKREEDGSFTQHVVLASDDAESEESALAGARDDVALDIPLHGDGGVGGLVASVEEATEDGFRLAVDASTLPADRGDESLKVLFKAFETTSLDHVDAGHFTARPAEGDQTVPIGIEANYLHVAAANQVDQLGDPHHMVDPGNLDEAVEVSKLHRLVDLEKLATLDGPEDAYRLLEPGEIPEAVDLDVPDEGIRLPRVSLSDGLGGDPVGLMVGEVTGPQPLHQHGQNSVVDPSSLHANSYGAFEDAALPLLDTGREAGLSGAIGRVRHLGSTTMIDYEPVGSPKAALEDTLVTYAALDTGVQAPPVQGVIELPEPGEADTREIEIGFSPAMVEFVACNADRLDRPYTLDTHALSFGWSVGTVMPNADGTIDHHLLHDSRTGEGFDAGGTSGQASGEEILQQVRGGRAPSGETPGSPPGQAFGAGLLAGLKDRLGSWVGRRTRWPDGGKTGSPKVEKEKKAKKQKALEEQGEGSTSEAEDPSEDQPPPAPSTPRGREGGSRAGGPRRPDAVAAAAFVLDEDGQVLGRQDLTVTAITDTGFEVKVDEVAWTQGQPETTHRAVVFYTAWPQPVHGPRRTLPG